jgi:hypothetical protein
MALYSGWRIRRGNAGLLVLVLILAGLLVGGGILWWGRSVDKAVQGHIVDGLARLDAGKPGDAVTAFENAFGKLGFPHSLFRGIGASAVVPADLQQLLVSSVLLTAYDGFFELVPQPDLLKKAEKALSGLSGAAPGELSTLVKTAAAVSELCRMVGEGQFREVMKQLLVAEKEALAEDRDFFIMEIRLLIACGKGLKAPPVLGQARELLWFISSEGGVKGPKVNRLWKLLSQ